MEEEYVELTCVNKEIDYPPKVRLMYLLYVLNDAKKSLCVGNSINREEIYNCLSCLEHELLQLRDKEVELVNDWWE